LDRSRPHLEVAFTCDGNSISSSSLRSRASTTTAKTHSQTVAPFGNLHKSYTWSIVYPYKLGINRWAMAAMRNGNPGWPPVNSNDLRRWGLRRLHNLLALTLGMLPRWLPSCRHPQTRAALSWKTCAPAPTRVLRRSVKKPKLTPLDRLLWAWLCRVWPDWPLRHSSWSSETVIVGTKRLSPFWTWKVGHGKRAMP